MSKTYKVVEMFQTIQGEGLHAGFPCAFLRFSGCNYWLDASQPSAICPFCDTASLHTGSEYTAEAIVFELSKYSRRGMGLVISGGEPLMQLDSDLLNALAPLFMWVDIETNGSLRFDFELPENVYISCSPKTGNIKVQSINWFKVLVPDKLNLLPKVVELANKHLSAIYLQPVEAGGYMSVTTQANIKQCIDLCTTHGHRLSIQTHKIIGVR